MSSSYFGLLSLLVTLLVQQSYSFKSQFPRRGHFSNSILPQYHPCEGKSASSLLVLQAVSDKTRVKLLADVKGIGKKGEIVFVSPSMYTNVLQVKKSAVRITDDEMKNMESREKETARQELEHARHVAETLKQLPLFHIARKVGANKQLFGSVSAKQLLEELKERLPAGSLDTPGMSRALAVLSIEEQLLVSEGSSTTTAPVPSSSPVRGDKDSKDKDTSKDKGELELRRAGRFVAWLRLHADLDPTPFSFAISSDKEKK